MSVKNKKQFGVWMNSNHAIIVGRKSGDTDDFSIVARANIINSDSNSNENSANNAEQGAKQKLFKEITSYMQNVDEVHVTGTGNAQEQFINYLARIPQYRNTVANESTSNKMTDEKLIEYISARFN